MTPPVRPEYALPRLRTFSPQSTAATGERPLPTPDPMRGSQRERLARIRENLAALKQAGAEPDEITQYIATEQTTPAEQMELSAGQTLAGGLRSVGQGVTFNFADEIEGGLRGMLPGRTREGETAKIRAGLEDFRAENPKAGFALEMLGGIGSGAAVAKGATAGLKGAKAASRVVGSGVASGALAGAGAAEGGVGNRLAGAGIGAAVGGTLGAAGGKIANAYATRAARKAAGVSPAAAAIADKAVNSGQTAASVRNAFTAQADSPEAMVVDVLGRPGARQARGIRVLGGEGAETIDNALTDRAAKQKGIITDELTSGAGRENMVGTAEAIAQRQRAQAAPLYHQAFASKAALQDDVIEEVLSRPGIPELVAEYAKNQKIAGKAVPMIYPEAKAGAVVAGLESTALVPEAGASPRPRIAPTLEAIDHVKKALDAGIEKSASGESRDKARAFALKEARRHLMGRVEELAQSGNPDAQAYAQARQVWGGAQGEREAIEEGAAFLKRAGDYRDPSSVRVRMKDMTPGERDLAERSFAHETLLYLDAANDNADLSKRLANDDFRSRVRAVFGDRSENVLKTLSTLRDQGRLRDFIQQGSQTADKISDAADAAGANFFDRLVGGTSATGATLGAVRDKFVRPLRATVGGKARAEQAQALTAPASGPKLNTKVLRELLAAMEAREGGRAAGKAVSGQIGRSTSTETTRRLQRR